MRDEKAASGDETVDALRGALASVIRGQGEAIELLLVGVVAGGHVLIEDVPGVGKTTLAKALSRALGLDFARIQLTPDLLPADILGASVLDPRDGSFSFHEGPVFTQLLLADEVNRASPRTQSALLEAMNEGQVTVDGVSRPLPRPFFVVATQNPVDFQGTYPLPEAQLDRFLLRVAMGYPAEEDEIEVLVARKEEDPLDRVEPVTDAAGALALQRRARGVAVAEDVARYLVRLVAATRSHPDLELGASPRASLALYRAAQARALLRGRSWAGPEDVQALLPAVLGHRLRPTARARYGGKAISDLVAEVVASVDVPT